MPRTEAASAPPSSSRLRAASRISSSVRARRGPGRRRMAGADIGVDYPLDATPHTVERSLDAVQILYAVQGVPMMPTRTGYGPRRTTGALFVAGALAFAGAATVLSRTMAGQSRLGAPADGGLPSFVAGGTSLAWTWFATAWTYAV